MVDVKKVTAVVTKDSIYNVTNGQNIVNGYVDFAPSSATVIDPFSMFRQNDSKFQVVIPYSRFYKVKYVIFPYSANVGGNDAAIFSWRTFVGFTEALNLMRVSSVTNVENEVISGIYKQDGVCLLAITPTSASTASKTYSFLPGVIEGIVELNAGDVLQFKHSLTLGARTFVTGFNALITDTSPPVGEYKVDILSATNTINNAIFSASSGFFFEISEITDL